MIKNSNSKEIIKNCKTVIEEGMLPVLTIRSNGADGKPTSPPKSTKKYREELVKIIKTRKPSVIAVEYKETSDLYYSGLPEEYLKSLKIAVETAHSFGVECTNGGMESDFVVLLVYANLIEKGDMKNASYFANKVFNSIQRKMLQTALTQGKLKTLMNKGKDFLGVYVRAGIDYLNIHWTIEDPQAFELSVDYLKKLVGIPLISTEIKIPNDPVKVNPLMKKVAELKFPCVIWFFGIEGQNINGLKSDKRLLPVTKKFRNFTKSHYDNVFSKIGNKIHDFYPIRIITNDFNKLFFTIKHKWRRMMNPKLYLKA